MRLVLAALTFVVASPAAAQPALTLPVDCAVGTTCFIQHYVDRDPGPGVRDYRCGSATYDGHNGTDFRLPTLGALRRGVAVRAAAPGQVLRVRDGMADDALASGKDAVRAVECGNGVVIDHGDGWQTQYCHLQKGSVAVRRGDTVSSGQPIGKIGLSGATEFPHLHFTVRHRDTIIDPFAPAAKAGDCTSARTLWEEPLARELTYVGTAILNEGFAGEPLSMGKIEDGAGQSPPGKDAPALVAFVRTINLKAGDTIALRLTGPDGGVLTESTPVTADRNKAQFLTYAGIRRPAAGWQPGPYRATFTLLRDQKPVITRTFETIF